MDANEDLSQYLKAKRDEIVERWVEESEKSDDLSITRSLSREEFRNGIPKAIDHLVRSFAVGAIESFDRKTAESISNHGHERWKQGFNLTELLHDWGILQRVVAEVVGQYFVERPATSDGTKREQVLDLVIRFFTLAMCESVSRYDEIKQIEASSVSRDIEKAKRDFEKVRQEQSALIRQISHDLRSELTTIQGASNILELEEPAKGGERHDLGSVISKSVNSVSETLDALLDLSRLDAGVERLSIEQVDVARMLGDIAARFKAVAEEKGLVLKTVGEATLRADSDPQKLKRIVQNLTVNALKYTEEGSVTIEWVAQPQNWLLRISDTGPGLRTKRGTPILREIDDPERGRSETHKRSMDYKGEGIGLTIVKRLSELLDASITVSSEEGKGTTFELAFPFSYSGNRHG